MSKTAVVVRQESYGVGPGRTFLIRIVRLVLHCDSQFTARFTVMLTMKHNSAFVDGKRGCDVKTQDESTPSLFNYCYGERGGIVKSVHFSNCLSDMAKGMSCYILLRVMSL